MSENNIVYRNAAELPMMEEVTENTYAIVSDGGVLKRVPGSMLGGSGGIKTAIIKSSNYDEVVDLAANYSPAPAGEPAITYECTNMTFEEAYETMKNGEPLAAMLMTVEEFPKCMTGFVVFKGIVATGEPMMLIVEPEYFMKFEWTANGIEKQKQPH